jgi:hypothetical protein
MPATQTRTQRSYVPYTYSSSSSKSSVLDWRTPFPHIWISKISLLDFGQLVSNEDTFNKVMATIGHRRSLVNQSKTIWHLWLTSRHLLEEVNRQRHEAREVFMHMEQMGLQQELYGSCFTASPVWGRLDLHHRSLHCHPNHHSLHCHHNGLSFTHAKKLWLMTTYWTIMSLKLPSVPFCHYLPHLRAW